MYIAPDWTIVQAFETLAACETVRGQEYSRAQDDGRRIGATLDEVDRSMLKFMLDKDALPPSERQKLIHGAVEHEPRLRDALVFLTVATMIHDSICVASDDPRIRDARHLALPPIASEGNTATGKGGVTVRYTPGRPIIVIARLNGRASARLLVDTGADRSVIKPRTIAGAGVDLSQPVARGRLRGIAGAVDALYFTLDSVAIGEAIVQGLRVAAHDAEANDVDGLLGRDFLDRFRIAIDPTAGTFRLAPK
jgi:predicted aspartyl protease